MRVTKSRCIAEYTAATQYTDKEVKQNNYKGILSHLMGSKTSRSDPKRGAAKADTANRERQNEQRKALIIAATKVWCAGRKYQKELTGDTNTNPQRQNKGV